MAISTFLSNVFWENIRCVCEEGGIHLLVNLNLTKGTRNYQYQSNEPPLKFTGSSFLYMPLGYNLQLLPWGLWGGGGHSQRHNFKTLNYVDKMTVSKILIECVWKKGGHGRGTSCPPITFDYQKGHWPFQFPIK